MIRKLRKVLCGVGCATLLLAPCITPAAQLQSGLPETRLQNFTNALAGVGGLHTTNSIHQITNGSTTITSAPVALRGRGLSLWWEFAPTNALLTNIAAELRLSPDGTNWADEPTITVRPRAGAIAAGRFVFYTNIAQTVVGEARFVQLWKLHYTNNVNNVGSVFHTNSGPTIGIQYLASPP